ncbi:(2Fe-2S) ferredoxin domain-containing protein, partial [Nostoc sp. NIES-2111]
MKPFKSNNATTSQKLFNASTSQQALKESEQNGLVLVCSQCTVEQFAGSSHRINRSKTASEELQNWLKSRLKFDGLWGKYRVVSTSCLGVCLQGVVVVVLRLDAVGQQCFIVLKGGEREILYSSIKQM